MAFNPFDGKSIGEVTVDDLKLLLNREVAEGYYVEYKRELQPSKKIAKSIAAFANTYGGWYIVGVETDQRSVATHLCGINLAALRDPISNVMEAVKSNTSPTPVFYPHLVSLGSDRAVLVVYVPAEQETPFITNDGRVYRRIHSSSDPSYEVERHTIDRLVDQGRTRVEEFERFCRDERTFSQGEAEQAWLNVFLAPQACAPLERFDIVRSAGMQALLAQSRGQFEILRPGDDQPPITSGVPFNHARVTARSLILRQVKPHTTTRGTLTIELFTDGRAKIHIPIQKFVVWDRHGLGGTESAELRSLLEEMLNENPDSMCLLGWFDFGELLLILASVFEFYRNWLGPDRDRMELKAAMTANNLWRGVPFFDADEWAAYARDLGIPVFDRDAISLPENRGRGILLDNPDQAGWMQLGIMLGLGMGLSPELLGGALVRAMRRVADQSSHSTTEL